MDLSSIMKGEAAALPIYIRFLSFRLANAQSVVMAENKGESATDQLVATSDTHSRVCCSKFEGLDNKTLLHPSPPLCPL